MQHSGGSSKRADAMTNRARILEAAQSVFAECGLELEMNVVAARAHLGVGTLYGHFANREELLCAIVRRATEDAFTRMQAAARADDPRAALQALVSVALQVLQQYRPLFVVIRDVRLEKLVDPSYGHALRCQFLEIPRELIDRGIQLGIFRKDLDPEMAAVIIMGSLPGTMDLLGTHCSLDELAQRLSHFLLTLFAEKVETADHR